MVIAFSFGENVTTMAVKVSHPTPCVDTDRKHIHLRKKSYALLNKYKTCAECSLARLNIQGNSGNN